MGKKRTIMDLDFNNPEDLEIALEMERGCESFECGAMHLKGGKMTKTELPMLFAYDSKGRVKTWHVEAIDEDIIVTTGLEDGKKKVTPSVAKGKNIGKANETTPAEQAVIEAKAKWVKQQERKGYVEDLSAYKFQYWCTLAKDWLKQKNMRAKLSKTRNFVQCKLDGVRMTIENTNSTMSRSRIEYKVKSQSFYDQISIFKETLESIVGADVVIDSEGYKHGYILQQIQKSVKKGEGKLSPDELELHIFDFYCHDKKDLLFSEREAMLIETFKRLIKIPGAINKIKHVTSKEVEDFDEFEKLVDEAGELGYEGIMIRNDSPYDVGNGSKRSSTLYKFKRFLDDEFKIIGVKETKEITLKSGEVVRQGQFICEKKHNDEIVTFKVVPVGESKGMRLDLLLNSSNYIGKLLKTKFQDFTADGKPSFAKGLAIRLPEDM